MYENAQWMVDPITKEKCAINFTKGGQMWSCPLDQDNTDYANLMELEREGKIVIQPADGEQQ